MMYYRSLIQWIIVLVIVLLCGVASLGTAAESRTLHALFVLDTRAAGLERSVPKNMQLYWALHNAFNNADPLHHFMPVVLDGAKVTKKNIFDYFKSLKATPNDTVMFYYSGHGKRDIGRGHLFDMFSGIVTRSDVRAALLHRKPRMAILLTDSCAKTYVTRKFVPGEPPAAARPFGNWEVIRQLFFQAKGFIDINAAANETYAVYNDRNGGLYTKAITDLLTSTVADIETNKGTIKDDRVDWSEIYAVAYQKMTDTGNALNIKQVPQRYFYIDTRHYQLPVFSQRHLVLFNHDTFTKRVDVLLWRKNDDGTWTNAASQTSFEHYQQHIIAPKDYRLQHKLNDAQGYTAGAFAKIRVFSRPSVYAPGAPQTITHLYGQNDWIDISNGGAEGFGYIPERNSDGEMKRETYIIALPTEVKEVRPIIRPLEPTEERPTIQIPRGPNLKEPIMRIPNETTIEMPRIQIPTEENL